MDWVWLIWNIIAFLQQLFWIGGSVWILDVSKKVLTVLQHRTMYAHTVYPLFYSGRFRIFERGFLIIVANINYKVINLPRVSSYQLSSVKCAKVTVSYITLQLFSHCMWKITISLLLGIYIDVGIILQINVYTLEAIR